MTAKKKTIIDRKEKAVFLQTTEKLTIEELAEKVSQIIDHDDAALFVAVFEKMYESWEVTEDESK